MDAINTAASLQAAAEPGEVLAGQETMWLTRRRIRYGGERELSLKGKSRMVAAYPALGLRQSVQEQWDEEWASPLVGWNRGDGRVAGALGASPGMVKCS